MYASALFARIVGASRGEHVVCPLCLWGISGRRASVVDLVRHSRILPSMIVGPRGKLHELGRFGGILCATHARPTVGFVTGLVVSSKRGSTLRGGGVPHG